MQIELLSVSTNCKHSVGLQTYFLPIAGMSIVTLGSIGKLRNRIARIAGNNGVAPSAPKTGRRIMVVDDEKDISLIFKSGLERNGFAVDVFNDPRDALSHYKSEYYSLLLLDVRMPGISGFELFREILKIDSAAKACFISAFEISDKEVAKYLPDHEVGCIIKKPISLKDLIKMVNEEISHKP